MNESDLHLIPPQLHIDEALLIESTVINGPNRDKYLEFLNGKPMSQRHTPRELRDGCILSNMFASIYLNVDKQEPTW